MTWAGNSSTENLPSNVKCGESLGAGYAEGGDLATNKAAIRRETDEKTLRQHYQYGMCQSHSNRMTKACSQGKSSVVGMV